MPRTIRPEKIDSARISTGSLSTLKVMTALAGHAVSGASNTEIASALSMTPSMVNRCVNTLIYAGYARKLDNGRFAPTPKFAALSRAVDQQMATAKDRLAEMEQNIQAISRGLF
ncbi:MAG: helix-turn-helix domain-containing protein [Rhodospirillaceae bacterium]|nr:helix-turn-helix domain-containing protein [Rhodospirillaceae bacterium]